MPTNQASFDDIETAFLSVSDETEAWFDRVTGEVILINEDTRFAFRQDPETLDDWEREEVARASRVWRAVGNWDDDYLGDAGDEDIPADRYVAIPGIHGYEAFQEMENFVALLEEENAGRVVEDLIRALRGKKPFRRFKDALLDNPAERERWFKFEAERLRERIEEWAKNEGITLN